MKGYNRITKEMFYTSGGFSNPRNVRKQSGKRWAYYQRQPSGFETTLTWDQI
jgi:hypothetical protein